VWLLASAGYDVFGLEASKTAAVEARMLKETVEGREEYKVMDDRVGKGIAKIVEGDFFADQWWEECFDGEEKKGFDLVYDYTFFCALPPILRSKWAARQAQILAPDGRLICLEFPLWKEPDTGGPPFALRPATYVAHLSRPGEEVEYEAGYVKNIDEENPDRSDKGLVRIAHFKAETSHEVGKGTDHISVWAHQ